MNSRYSRFSTRGIILKLRFSKLLVILFHSLRVCQVIVVTGASSGIGAGIAKYFAAHGASVVLAARNLEGLQAVGAEIGDSSKYLIYQADVSKRSDHAALLAASIERYGHISVWINNAGAGVFKSVFEMEESDLDAMINVNTKSVLFGMQVAVKYFMKHSAEGVVINVSSLLARIPMATDLAAYNASKHAVNSLTANAQMDLQAQGCKNIHVCLLSPGLVNTDIAKHAIGGPSAQDHSSGQSVAEVVQVVSRIVQNPAQNRDVYSSEGYKRMVVKYFER